MLSVLCAFPAKHAAGPASGSEKMSLDASCTREQNAAVEAYLSSFPSYSVVMASVQAVTVAAADADADATANVQKERVAAAGA